MLRVGREVALLGSSNGDLLKKSGMTRVQKSISKYFLHFTLSGLHVCEDKWKKVNYLHLQISTHSIIVQVM